jgi:MFS family permease
LNNSQPERPGIAGFFTRISGSLQVPAYRVFYSTTLGQSAGMVMGQVTGPLLIYRLTGSSVLLGTMSLVVAMPLIIMSFLGGVIADRIAKKHIVCASLLGFAAVQLIVAVGLQTGFISREHSGSWLIILATSFIQGGLMGLMMPAFQAIIPEIIRKDLVMNASALNILGMNITGLVIPVVTGIIIDNVGFEYAYYAAASLYTLGGIAILFIPRSRVSMGKRGKILSEIKNGLIYIRQVPVVLYLLLFTTVVVVFSMPYQQLLPIFTDNILKVGATGMGLLMSVSGAGALAGSLLLTVSPGKKRGLMLLSGGLIAGLALLVFSFSSIWALSLAVMVFVGLAQTFRNTLGNALLLTHTEAPYLGRVMSLLNMQWGIMAILTFLAGLLAGSVPVQWVLGSLAMLLVVVSIIFMVFSPRTRKLV